MSTQAAIALPTNENQKTQIDFSKYRTPQLVKSIFEIVSLPGIIKVIFKCVFCGLIGLMAFVGFFLWLTGNLTFFWTTLFELYSGPAGMLGGFALGVAEFVRRSLGNMLKLSQLTVATTIQISLDYEEVSAGEKEMPPTRDLVHDVYEQLILVIVNEVIMAMFGLFGYPIYWIYHITLNQFIRLIIRWIPILEDDESRSTAPMDDNENSQTAEPDKGDPDNENVTPTNPRQNRVVKTMTWVDQKLQSIGFWLQVLVMIPCYVILAIVIWIILSPIALMYWFAM